MEAFMQRNFAVSLRASDVSEFPYSLSQLMDDRLLSRILEEQSRLLGEPRKRVVGTLFAKRYSVLAAGLAAAFSMYDTALSLDDGRIRFAIAGSGVMHYEAESDGEIVAVCERGRRRHYAAYVQRTQNHVQSVFEAVSSATGASLDVMWSLAAHQVQTTYCRLAEEAGRLRDKNRLRLIGADRDVLMDQAGNRTLAMRHVEFLHSLYDGPPMLLRRYCCLAYLTGQGQTAHSYCGTCPKLKADERLALLRNR